VLRREQGDARGMLPDMALLVAVGITLGTLLPSSSTRPPQFVIISFDGSGDAADVRAWIAAGDRFEARFTFFLSGVYLLAGDRAYRYAPPQHVRGSSDIGFALAPDGTDVRSNIADLVDALNDASASGHEIATHFNGHFCGRRPGAVSWWSVSDWTRELDQFDALARDVRANNGISRELRIPPVSGARTPCLEGNLSFVRAALAQRGMRYDASTPGYPGVWPWRDGVWVFPIPLVPVADESFATLASDYNFYLNQSGAVDSAASDAPAFADQTYRSLRAYFDEQYLGERAPISIAYHFEDWNHGAYRDALRHLIFDVCGKPDVRCTTYRDVVAYLDAGGPRS
jgi:hypothetical protein